MKISNKSLKKDGKNLRKKKIKMLKLLFNIWLQL
jgi:hypothetical protein